MLPEDSNWQDILDAMNDDDLETAQRTLEEICDQYDVNDNLAEQLQEDIENSDSDQFMDDAGL